MRYYWNSHPSSKVQFSTPTAFFGVIPFFEQCSSHRAHLPICPSTLNLIFQHIQQFSSTVVLLQLLHGSLHTAFAFRIVQKLRIISLNAKMGVSNFFLPKKGASDPLFRRFRRGNGRTVNIEGCASARNSIRTRRCHLFMCHRSAPPLRGRHDRLPDIRFHAPHRFSFCGWRSLPPKQKSPGVFKFSPKHIAIFSPEGSLWCGGHLNRSNRFPSLIKCF